MDNIRAILKTAFAGGGKRKSKRNKVTLDNGRKISYAQWNEMSDEQKKKESEERRQKQKAQREEDNRKKAEREEMENLLQNVSSGRSKNDFKAYNSNPLIPNGKSATELNSMPANLGSIQNMYKPLSKKDTPLKLGLMDDSRNKVRGTHECYVKNPIYCNKDGCEDFSLPRCVERKRFASVRGGMKLLSYKKYLEDLNVDRLHKIAKSKGIKITKKTNGKTVYVKKATLIKKLYEHKYGKK